MDKHVLVIKYHPAKKEIQFVRLEYGKPVTINDDSKLTKYTRMKGSFVLQNQGTDFFNDIADVFDALENVVLKLKTTKIDYDDFNQMVDYYNNNNDGKCKFSAILDTELPSMQETFEMVKNWGNGVVNTLNELNHDVLNIESDKEDVKKSIETIANDIENEKKNIEEKIKAMDDNNINLCFVGVYSAGKSALINAILGYRILPEAIESKTAKMFCISSPKENENISISFGIDSIATQLEWNSAENCFEFVYGPSENQARNEIQTLLNDAKGEKDFKQINEVLELLNSKEEVSSQIIIHYPIALDNEKEHYTIYDTPGSDSNFESHQIVLEKALSEQMQSILIFVAHPTKLEGEGNSALLNFLKSVKSNNIKTCIDLDRSIFVMNFSDTLDKEERKRSAESGVVKCKTDGSFQIKLSDKKVLFAAANCSYIAKARKNGVETDEEKKDGEFDDAWYNMIVSKPKGFCYKQNRCAQVEYATKTLEKKCDDAYEKAQKKDDKAEQLAIASGIYALEEEIKIYGEKYAYATKVFAIIDSVDRALGKLQNTLKIKEDFGNEAVKDLDEKLNKEKDRIKKEIESAYKKYMVKTNRTNINSDTDTDDGQLIEEEKVKLDKEDIKDLCLDDDSLKEIINSSIKKVESKIGNFLGITFIGQEKRDGIYNILKNVVDKHFEDFSIGSQILLEKKKNEFIGTVEHIICQSESLTESQKTFLCGIDINAKKEYFPKNDVNKALDEIIRTFLWMDFANMDQLTGKIDALLTVKAGVFFDKYKEHYKSWLKITLDDLKGKYLDAFEVLSGLIKSMNSDKKTFENLLKRIEGADCRIRSHQEQLDNKLWNNGEYW